MTMQEQQQQQQQQQQYLRREYLADTCAALKKRRGQAARRAGLATPDATPASRLTARRRYGCFGAKEQPLWPAVTRRNGIPSLVVVGPDGALIRNDDAMARG